MTTLKEAAAERAVRIVDGGSAGRTDERRQRPAASAADSRARYFELALNRGARDEPVEMTLARAETIRRYIEDGAVSPAPC